MPELEGGRGCQRELLGGTPQSSFTGVRGETEGWPEDDWGPGAGYSVRGVAQVGVWPAGPCGSRALVPQGLPRDAPRGWAPAHSQTEAFGGCARGVE